MITFTCPHCSDNHTVTEKLAGKTYVCGSCGAQVNVPAAPKKKRGCLRTGVNWAFTGLFAILILGFIVLAILFRSAVYNRFVAFPREAQAWKDIQDARVNVTLDDGWTEFRGVCHSHSEVSHDSMVPFEEILQVMKDTERDFICMSDHCVDNLADFSVQWQGVKDGVLFVRGYEMGYGFMPFGVSEGVVLKKDEEPEVLAQQIVDAGGLLFFAHTEQDRQWDLPQLTGMEIYNIHTDILDEDGDIIKTLLPDIILSLRSYGDHVFRTFFDRQTAILANWDRLNRDRKIVGIAANDCHQNQGYLGRYTADDTLLLEDTSPEVLKEIDLNFFTRTLLRLFPGPLTPGEEVFHVQLDPYERMTRYVATHVLANELTQEALMASLKEGRVFIGFDMLADCRGFVYLAEDGAKRAVMGETLPFTPGVRLRAASPQACRFTVVRDGEPVHRSEGAALDWQPVQPGKYRVEAELDILGEWTPWIYTNPLELTPAA